MVWQKLAGKGRALPLDTARAPSGAEGAGPGAGTFQVTAKAAENRLRGQSYPCLPNRFFFWTGRGPFSFSEKENGGRIRPLAPERETLRPWGPPLPGVGVVAEAQEVVGGHAVVLTDQGDLLRCGRPISAFHFADVGFPHI